MDSKYTANNFKFILKFAKNLGTASFWLHPSDQAPPSNDFLPSRDSSGIEHVVSSANGGRSGAAQPTAAKQAQRIHHSARAILWVDTRSHFYYLRPLAEYSRNHMHPNACSKFHPRSANFKICRKMKNMKTFQKKTADHNRSKTFAMGKLLFLKFNHVHSNSFNSTQLKSSRQQPRALLSHSIPQCMQETMPSCCGGSISNAVPTWKSGSTLWWMENSWNFMVCLFSCFFELCWTFSIHLSLSRPILIASKDVAFARVPPPAKPLHELPSSMLQ
jgi:hypothetical protein